MTPVTTGPPGEPGVLLYDMLRYSFPASAEVCTMLPSSTVLPVGMPAAAVAGEEDLGVRAEVRSVAEARWPEPALPGLPPPCAS